MTSPARDKVPFHIYWKNARFWTGHPVWYRLYCLYRKLWWKCDGIKSEVRYFARHMNRHKLRLLWIELCQGSSSVYELDMLELCKLKAMQEYYREEISIPGCDYYRDREFRAYREIGLAIRLLEIAHDVNGYSESNSGIPVNMRNAYRFLPDRKYIYGPSEVRSFKARHVYNMLRAYKSSAWEG